MSDLRAMIREILAEELATLSQEKAPGLSREMVPLPCSGDLTAFVQDLLVRAEDPEFVRAIKDGRHVFELDRPISAASPRTGAASVPYTLAASMPARPPELTKPMITERDLAQVPRDQTRLRVGRNSRLTPLASDELKRRGIKIERMQT